MTLEAFTLLGGPLHRMGRRMGLVRDDGDSLRLGVAIGVVLWMIVMLGTLAEGTLESWLSLAKLSEHVRFLLVVPLLFLCDSWVSARQAAFARELLGAKVISRGAKAKMERTAVRLMRLKQSTAIELLLLAIAVVLAIADPEFAGNFLVPGQDEAVGVVAAPLGQDWYRGLSLIVFRFVLFVWLWRHLLWCLFLWRLSRRTLNLFATHPDGVGGLGYLEIVHFQFCPAVLALSMLQSAFFAELIVTEQATLQLMILTFALLLVAILLLFAAPLLFFFSNLWSVRLAGLAKYSVLSNEYVAGFENKWADNRHATKETLLGSADIQSLADLANSFEAVQRMRLCPASSKLLLGFAVVAVVPILPLVLLRYPLWDVAEAVFKSLTGF